ncbi:MAG: glycosyl transferase family protein [Deltaproteobacteria bacterium]|nr:glycosyl transferase family protein [Deltaproteobacteria bacterium]
MDLNFFDSVVLFMLPPLFLSYLFFGIDDLLIDFWRSIKKIRPVELTPENIEKISHLKEKRVAILVAAWQEGGVLRRMVTGNMREICYQNFDIFLGVYPNDRATVREAESLEKEFERVHVVINRKEGPTSKGQMLNEVVRALFSHERENGAPFDALLIHDSEDLIHPLSLKIINWKLTSSDFVQLPVFPIEMPLRALVAGTYMDEFAEAHTKTLLVRESLGASLPSAGVGTALSRKLVNTLVGEQKGFLMNESTLTEDYDLGVRCRRERFSQAFACYYYWSANRKREFIATRAYFPRKLLKSIRQKTRWNFGITFQGTEQIGWLGSLANRYFLYRDRKGLVSNIIAFIGLFACLYGSLQILLPSSRMIEIPPLLQGCAFLNLLFMLHRSIERMRAAAFVYCWKTAFFVPFRLLVGNVVNGLASLRATSQFFRSKLFGDHPVWIKTEHELPSGFGLSATQEVKA